MHGAANSRAFDESIHRQRAFRAQRHEERLNDQYGDIAFQLKSRLNLTGPAGLLVFGLLMSSIVMPAAADAGEEAPSPPVGAKISSSLNKTLEFHKTIPDRHHGGEETNTQVLKLSRQEVEVLYEDVRPISPSGFHGVYSAVLKEDREGAPAGTKVALRCNKIYTIPMLDADLWARSILSSIGGLSAYIPKIYGVWQGPWTSDFVRNEFWNENTTMRCQEIEFLDTNYPNLYGDMSPSPEERIGEFMDISFDILVQGQVNRLQEAGALVEYKTSAVAAAYKDYLRPTLLFFGNSRGTAVAEVGGSKMSDRLLFEHYIGNWAVNRVGKMSVHEAGGDQLRHHLVKYDENSLVYRIGEEIYLFPPGESPRQVDYDLARRLEEKKMAGKYFLNCDDFFYEYYFKRASEMGQGFIASVCEGVGLFDSIKRHFGAYRVSAEAPLPSGATYYEISAEYLGD